MSATPPDRARDARLVVRAARGGALASHSLELAGYPYGSALPYATDHSGRPVILISHLAEHTHNIEADPRVSFLVADMGADLQSAPRVALLGDATRVADPAALQARYLRLFPEHAYYLEIGGFAFWAITPRAVRFIAGFGSLHWLEGEQFLAQPGELPGIEDSALEHMNDDHADALHAYAQKALGRPAQTIDIVGLDCDGFDLRADGALLRIAFDEVVTTAPALRAKLAAMAREARA